MPPRIIATTIIATTLALALIIGGCKRSSGAFSSDARISANEIAFGTRKAELPAKDVGAEPPQVMQDAAAAADARRLAYRTSSGQARLIYVVGDGLFVGPLVPDPVDFRAAPDVDHALAPLYEAAASPTRRLVLAQEVKKEKGEAAVVRLLIDAAYVDDAASWDEARKTLLSQDNQKAVADAMAVGLEKGKSIVLLRRAVALADLHTAERAKLIAFRAKELSGDAQRGKESGEPRAVAALLRAVIANEKSPPKPSADAGANTKNDDAGATPTSISIACDALKTVDAKDPERAVFAEAVLLAIANARLSGDTTAACVDADGAIEKILVAESCVPHLRCGSDGQPVRWADSSKQDEPLCTKEQAAEAVKKDLERPTAEILNASATRTELFAYASLLATDHVPASFTTVHTRRRYPITQPAEPVCDNTVVPNAACHCDEPTLRSAVCRAPADASSAASGFCKLDIDDKQKKLQNVVAGTGTAQ